MVSKITLPKNLCSEQVLLEQRNHQYDEALFALIDGSREFLRRYLFWVDSVTDIESVAKTTDRFLANWQKQDSYEYVYLDPQSRKLVGAGGIHTIDYDNSCAAFGYYLDKNSTGHGYASGFVKLVEETLFAAGIHRLEIRCEKDNLASAAVAKRCGYQYEGCRRDGLFAYGTYRDELIFAKLNPKG